MTYTVMGPFHVDGMWIVRVNKTGPGIYTTRTVWKVHEKDDADAVAMFLRNYNGAAKEAFTTQAPL